MKLFDFIRRSKPEKAAPPIEKFESKENNVTAEVIKKTYKNADLFQDDNDLGYC